MLTPEQLYRECEGDPILAPDSEAETYGYKAGGGTDMRMKLDIFNARQDSGSVRPITVSIRPPSKTGPGVVSGAIPIQLLKTATDLDELHWLKQLMPNGDNQNQNTQLMLDKWNYVELVILAGPISAENDLQFTDELQSLVLEAVPQSTMPKTRANLISVTDRDGSRSEEMQGFQATLQDFQDAEEWMKINDPTKPSLYS